MSMPAHDSRGSSSAILSLVIFIMACIAVSAERHHAHMVEYAEPIGQAQLRQDGGAAVLGKRRLAIEDMSSFGPPTSTGVFWRDAAAHNFGVAAPWSWRRALAQGHAPQRPPRPHSRCSDFCARDPQRHRFLDTFSAWAHS